MSFENPECQSLWNLKAYMDNILSQNRYISKSEYNKIAKLQISFQHNKKIGSVKNVGVALTEKSVSATL